MPWLRRIQLRQVHLPHPPSPAWACGVPIRGRNLWTTSPAAIGWSCSRRWKNLSYPLKTINPDIILHNAANACELWYDSFPDAAPEDNAHILDIPPERFMTQVGTTLTQDVDATSTTFNVADSSATDDEEIYQLFVAGDTVLIEGETIVVEAVDEAAKTLTVRRGFVRPAAAHSARSRLTLGKQWPAKSWGSMMLSTRSSMGSSSKDW